MLSMKCNTSTHWSSQNRSNVDQASSKFNALKELHREAELILDMNDMKIDKYMKADHKTFFEQF